MGDILLPFQLRLLRQTFLQVALVLAFEGVITTFLFPAAYAAPWLWGFTGLALLAWATTDERRRRSGYAHFLFMQACLLVSPWFMGGVRSPAAYFSLILLHPAALLLGMRAAWTWVGLFVANILLLMGAELSGRIPGHAPSALATMATLSAMILYTLFFIASPLVYIRKLFEVATNHVEERRALDLKLQDLSLELERRVRERSGALLDGRHRLQDLARANAEQLSVEIARLRRCVEVLEGLYAQEQHPASRRALERIRLAQGRLERMHAALANFCDLVGKPLQLEIVSAAHHEQLVREVWDELVSQPTTALRLSLGSLPACKADPALLRHVWQNLLSNALKYSSQAAAPLVEVFQQDGAICVKDNGVGFESEAATKLFGLFQRLHTEDEFKGTGVGLALVHRILELHGGSIRATSRPGHGAQFAFTLPSWRRPESAFGLEPVSA